MIGDYLSYLAGRYHEYTTPRPQEASTMAAEKFTIRGRPRPTTPCLCRGAGQHCRNQRSVTARRQREQQAQQQAPAREEGSA